MHRQRALDRRRQAYHRYRTPRGHVGDDLVLSGLNARARERFLESPLFSLVETRIARRLAREGLTVVGDVLTRERASLLALSGFGKVMLGRVEDALWGRRNAAISEVLVETNRYEPHAGALASRIMARRHEALLLAPPPPFLRGRRDGP